MALKTHISRIVPLDTTLQNSTKLERLIEHFGRPKLYSIEIIMPDRNQIAFERSVHSGL
jgi:hypothetical protein